MNPEHPVSLLIEDPKNGRVVKDHGDAHGAASGSTTQSGVPPVSPLPPPTVPSPPPYTLEGLNPTADQNLAGDSESMLQTATNPRPSPQVLPNNRAIDLTGRWVTDAFGAKSTSWHGTGDFIQLSDGTFTGLSNDSRTGNTLSITNGKFMSRNQVTWDVDIIGYGKGRIEATVSEDGNTIIGFASAVSGNVASGTIRYTRIR